MADDVESNGDDGISAPKKPAVGMRFDNIEAAKQHYVDYARWNGFGVRIDYQRPIKSGETSRAQFVCYKAGKNKKGKEDTQLPESVVPKRKRNITERTGCQARMKVKLDGATYIVEHFEEEHNHHVLKKIQSRQERILGAERQAEAETALTVPRKCGFSLIEEQAGSARGFINRMQTSMLHEANRIRASRSIGFQEELQMTSSYHSMRTGVNTYETMSMTGNSGQYGSRTYKLAVDMEADMYSCECCKFDRDGIMCCHSESYAA
ncbi:uncharacterized protein LOC104585121 [Brachypodium distachyon]|uniref:uncharacterized protein LOC104585121 n=1 Tax=Brachypodium distachyon TaxID=15368 RepID=UPI00052FE0BB|nr:uncharacterized protein LOC104585121 [Brachypodium distachyon]|eukprot:XP_024310413.1 uncharacterized protein LOC104585121 [Brachypodium distachyon]